MHRDKRNDVLWSHLPLKKEKKKSLAVFCCSIGPKDYRRRQGIVLVFSSTFFSRSFMRFTWEPERTATSHRIICLEDHYPDEKRVLITCTNTAKWLYIKFSMFWYLIKTPLLCVCIITFSARSNQGQTSILLWAVTSSNKSPPLSVSQSFRRKWEKRERLRTRD